jgi:hypothetical protein
MVNAYTVVLDKLNTRENDKINIERKERLSKYRDLIKSLSPPGGFCALANVILCSPTMGIWRPRVKASP